MDTIYNIDISILGENSTVSQAAYRIEMYKTSLSRLPKKRHPDTAAADHERVLDFVFNKPYLD
jgi:hypothetical protein